MPRFAKGLTAAAVLAVALPAWGYWFSLRHAYVSIRVEDYSLKSATLAYGTPHGATLSFRDESGAQLATARSVEPLGYILAVHPDAAIGNCEHRVTDHAECYGEYSAWSAAWAPQVRSADVAVGSCRLQRVPVRTHRSNDEWMVWWVPLPHVGGLPRQYFDFAVAIDAKACAAIRKSGSVPEF